MYRDERLLHEKKKRCNTIVLQSIPLEGVQESDAIREYTQLMLETIVASFGVPWYVFYSPGEILAAIMAAEEE